jgi:serine/threonine-protein kinase RsbW
LIGARQIIREVVRVDGKDFNEPCAPQALPRPEDRAKYPVRLRISYPSTKQALNRAVSDVLKMAERCGCIDDDQMDLEIALREALANAITHGNGSRTAKRIFLRCYGSPGSDILVLVRDEGDGFDPEQVPDPRNSDRRLLHHGRGLLLMRKLMDHVAYRKEGREVLIYKAVTQPDD